jgi:ParB-like chromosome segregation protein Spo0J
MDIIKIKLSELKSPEKNVRIHTEKQIKEFERSITMFGQIRPIVVDENNIILAGNGIYETLKKLGTETADVLKYENLTENQKKKLMIADNKIFSLGIEDLDTLNTFLEDLKEDLDIPGYDEDILKQMVCQAEDVTEKISEYGKLNDEEIQQLKDNKDKKEGMISKAEERTNKSVEAEAPSNTATEESKAPAGERTINNSDNMQPVNTSKIKTDEQGNQYIICEKCGERICL